MQRETAPGGRTDSGAGGERAEGFPFWKRVFDLALVLVTLMAWLPVVALVALWIKIVSPGPVLFKQERVGYRGQRFIIFKFRSMKAGAETRVHENHFDQLVESDRPMEKLDAAGDPRLIPGGRLLRAAGLDELPQIFNVIRGDMSLVGPRPCTVRESVNFEGRARERFQAPPGLTGYWQINGKNRTTFSQMVELDIYYARRMSLWLDLYIILRTLPALTEQVQMSWGRTTDQGILPGRSLPGMRVRLSDEGSA